MKKYYISFFVIGAFLILGILSLIMIQNKSIENQPKKAKLVIDIEGKERKNGERKIYNILKAQEQDRGEAQYFYIYEKHM